MNKVINIWVTLKTRSFSNGLAATAFQLGPCSTGLVQTPKCYVTGKLYAVRVFDVGRACCDFTAPCRAPYGNTGRGHQKMAD